MDCYDANEAGFATDSNGQLYGTGFDANGIVIGNSDGYTGTRAAVTNASNTSACLDTDSDGIYDTIDIDDDNDGILDTEEYGDIPKVGLGNPSSLEIVLSSSNTGEANIDEISNGTILINENGY